jgi:hypothetical protein
LSDINNDFIPDFTLVVKNSASSHLSFEQWIRDTGSNSYAVGKNYDAPTGLKIYGQSIFADYGIFLEFFFSNLFSKIKIKTLKDSDGTIEHLLPGCKDTDCKQSVIYIYKQNEVNYLFSVL